MPDDDNRSPQEKQALWDFGQNLRAIRRAAGLTQEDVAERSGLHRNYIGLVERGKRAPSVLVLMRLGEALGVDPGRFLEGRSIPPQ